METRRWQIGYALHERYRIADLTREAETYRYRYTDAKGKKRIWKDKVGRSWRDADFRISFAKCKTHEHDWLTLGVKNVYGCLPRPNKVQRYHIRQEVSDLAARALVNFPVHFAFVDAWIASDGFQGYKIPHPRPLKMLFGGHNIVAVDMEIFSRAGVEPYKASMLRRSVEQLSAGEYPKYLVRGDQHTTFQRLGAWENISQGGGKGHHAMVRCHDCFAQFGRLFRRFDRSAHRYLTWIEIAACVIFVRSGVVR